MLVHADFFFTFKCAGNDVVTLSHSRTSCPCERIRLIIEIVQTNVMFCHDISSDLLLNLVIL